METSLPFEHFITNIQDPRSYRNQKHPFRTLIGVSFLGILCGLDSFYAIAEYAELNSEELAEYFDFPHGIPSHDTFARVWENLDHNQFRESFDIFLDFLKEAADHETKIINIDGKTIRNSGNEEHGPLHMVSAWCSANSLVLAQEKVNGKSNEITAIPLLLKQLSLADKIITIDAMGAQRDICNQITDEEGDYVVALKGNQPTLQQDVMVYVEGTLLKNENAESHIDIDKGHGRIETRQAWVINAGEWLQARHNWPGLKSVIVIRSTIERKCKKEGYKKTEEIRVYLSSLILKPKEAGYIVRNHWAIENTLHWRLDCSFNEDKSCITNENAVENMHTLRAWALNALSQIRSEKETTKGMLRKNLISFRRLILNVKKIFMR